MKLLITMTLASLLSVSTLAVADPACPVSVDANPNIIIPVYVERYTESSTHPDNLGMSYDSYEVKFGADNEFDTVCIRHRYAVMLFTLPKRSNFEFIDARFFENGQPSTQIIQYEVHANYIRVVNKNDSPENVKYVLVLRDKENGATIIRDPEILNEDIR